MPSQSRQDQRETFIKESGWADAECRLLAADASFRHYYRLTRNGQESAVLMDAPPEKEDTRPFIRVTEIVSAYGIAAPHIHAQDTDNGFLLLKDFGDARLSGVLTLQPERESALYGHAIDMLVALYKQRTQHPHPEVGVYDTHTYMREVSLFSEWWVPHHLGDKAEAFNAEFDSIWQRILQGVSLHQGTLVLRDYHADNLMCLSENVLGVLDYQDALMGDPAYDVVSLLEDARRDVSDITVNGCLRDYLLKTDQDEEDFKQRYAVLGAQRNLKILGIFMRLCLRDGKAHYLALLPRVWGHLETDMQHPLLADLRTLINDKIPQAMRGIPAIEKAA